jgi:NADH-quinone oxidoreductase subunit N
VSPLALDLTTPGGVLTALLPELVLGGWSLVVLLLTAWRHGRPEDSVLAGRATLAGLVLALGAICWLWLGGASAVGIPHMVAVDAWRFAGSALIVVVAIGVTLLALGYLPREGMIAPEFYVLLLLATCGLTLMAAATDLMLLFLGLELMSVAVYVLAGFDRRSAASAEGALKYFLIGAFASGFLLYGVALVYGATGTTNMVLAGAQFTDGLPLLAALGLGLLVIGLGFKVAAVPMHAWAPDVYDGAPTPVTTFMAAGVKAAAFLAFGRLLMTTFPAAADAWRPAVFGLAVATMVVGNLVALRQRSLKRMLAYSSVAHAGYLLAALVPGNAAGTTALLVYLAAYLPTTVAAFGLLQAVGRNGERDVTLDGLAGLARERPWLAFGLTICMLSLLGFPGTFGFIGKWVILGSLAGAGQGILAVVLVLASVVSAGYYLPVVMTAYMRPLPAEGAHAGAGLPRAAGLAVAVAVAIVVVFGIWPAGVLDLSARSAAALAGQGLEFLGVR